MKINTIIVSGSELKGANVPEKPPLYFTNYIVDGKTYQSGQSAWAAYEKSYNSAIEKAIPFADQLDICRFIPKEAWRYDNGKIGIKNYQRDAFLISGIYPISPIECEEQRQWRDKYKNNHEWQPIETRPRSPEGIEFRTILIIVESKQEEKSNFEKAIEWAANESTIHLALNNAAQTNVVCGNVNAKQFVTVENLSLVTCQNCLSKTRLFDIPEVKELPSKPKTLLSENFSIDNSISSLERRQMLQELQDVMEGKPIVISAVKVDESKPETPESEFWIEFQDYIESSPQSLVVDLYELMKRFKLSNREPETGAEKLADAMKKYKSVEKVIIPQIQEILNKKGEVSKPEREETGSERALRLANEREALTKILEKYYSPVYNQVIIDLQEFIRGGKEDTKTEGPLG